MKYCEGERFDSVQHLHLNEVAELRWDGASKLIGEEDPTMIRNLKTSIARNEID